MSNPSFITMRAILLLIVLVAASSVSAINLECNIPKQGAAFNYSAAVSGTYTAQLESFLVRYPPVSGANPQSPISEGLPATLTLVHEIGKRWDALYAGQSQYVRQTGSKIYNAATAQSPAFCLARNGLGGSDLYDINRHYDAAARLQFLEADGQGTPFCAGEFASVIENALMREPLLFGCPYRFRWFGLTGDVGSGNQAFASLIYTEPFTGRLSKFSFSQFIYEAGVWYLVSGVYTVTSYSSTLLPDTLPVECQPDVLPPYNPVFAPDAVLAPGSPALPIIELEYVGA